MDANSKPNPRVILFGSTKKPKGIGVEESTHPCRTPQRISKGRVYQTVVRSTLPYGWQAWQVQDTDEMMLDVFDNDITRRIL